jgi:hypothetical protein
MIIPALIDLILISAIGFTGILATRLLWRDASGIELLSLSFPLGSGILTWLFFVSGWAGLAFTRVAVFITWALICSLMIVVHSWNRNQAPVDDFTARFFPRSAEWGQFDILAVVLMGIALLIWLFISIGRSYSVYDGIAMWAPKGYGIAMERSLWGARWGNHGYSYPFHIHFLIALFRLFSGDLLPGSKAIFPLFYFSLLLGVYAYWMKKDVSPPLRLGGILVLMTVPTFFTFSTIGYPNLPMASYLTLAVLVGLVGMSEGKPGKQVLSGLLFGFTVWTVIEGMLYVGVVMVVILAVQLRFKDGKLNLVAWILPALLVGGIWYIFFRVHGAGGSQALDAGSRMLEAWRGGDWRLSDARLILGYARRNIFDPQTWGLVFPLGIIMLLSGWRALNPGRFHHEFTLLIVTGITASLSLALFYLRSFFIPGLYELLERGFPRGFISPAIFLFVLAVAVSNRMLIPQDDHRK